MAPITVACSLNIYEAEAKGASSTAAGVIEIRIRLRYQLRIKAYGVEELIEDVITPELSNPFSMPLTFLFPELSITHVWNMLQSLDVDANACDYLSPKIAEFAVDVAKRRGAMENSSERTVITVAEVEITKVDFIFEEEFDKLGDKLC
ncbi:hypothetical protein QQP08_001760 [Theobroma cacao]|nr:hypothetical protein QQP08_001760 [Theobroma cacao]